MADVQYTGLETVLDVLVRLLSKGYKMGKAGTDERPLLKASCVADRLCVCRTTARKVMRELGAVDVYGCLRLHPKLLDKYIERGGDSGYWACRRIRTASTLSLIHI